MGFSGKNTRVGCHALLQGTFPTQGSNLCLLHCRQILYCLSHQEGPFAFVQLHKWLFSENWRSFPGCGHAETLIARTHAKSWLIGKDSDAGRDWEQEKGTTEDEMAGWQHWLDGRESEWTPGVGDGQGGLACCDSWGHKESDTTEWLNWTELILKETTLVSYQVFGKWTYIFNDSSLLTGCFCF